jgi:anti-anti-sigma regulatory factor/HAMP domain-containing protein
MRRSLRTRLLAIVLISIVLLTIVNVLVGAWGLGRVRDRAIGDSSEALQRQAEGYLLRLAQERAIGTSQTIGAARQILVATKDFLIDSRITGERNTPIAWLSASDGRRYYQGATTVLVPSDSKDPNLLKDMRISQGLDALLPGQADAVPDVVRVSYMTSAGALRTYPRLDIADLPVGWRAQDDPSYVASLPNNDPLHQIVWTNLHPTLDNAGLVFSLATPIYNGSSDFRGVVTVDISVDNLGRYLERTQVERTGFAFLVDGQSRLIATTEKGGQQLIGHKVTRSEQGVIALDKAIPSLAVSLAELRAGHSAVARVEILGRPYLLVYAPISGIDWGLGIAAPLDEITTSTTETTTRISAIAGETSLLILAASLAAVVTLSLAMGLVLGHQLIRPLSALIGATEAIAAGDPRPIAIAGDDELGRLAASFNAMTGALESSRAEITATNQRLELTVKERTADLDLAVGRLEHSFATQQELLRTLRNVSTPVIPVIEGVLAMPLIGQLDDERAQHMTRVLLERIEHERASVVLLDITGVPVIDTQVAQALLRTVTASGLLGAEVVLVGVAPEVAQTIVALGLDLRGLSTAADLRSAVERIMADRRNNVKAAPVSSHRNL